MLSPWSHLSVFAPVCSLWLWKRPCPKAAWEDGIYLAYQVIVHCQRKQSRNGSRDQGVKLLAGLLRLFSYTLQDHCSGIALLKVGCVPLYQSVKKMPHRLDYKPVWRGMFSVEIPSFQITLESANLTNQLAQPSNQCTLCSICMLVNETSFINICFLSTYYRPRSIRSLMNYPGWHS